jgi:putative DNA primase/helicase
MSKHVHDDSPENRPEDEAEPQQGEPQPKPAKRQRRRKPPVPPAETEPKPEAVPPTEDAPNPDDSGPAEIPVPEPELDQPAPEGADQDTATRGELVPRDPNPADAGAQITTVETGGALVKLPNLDKPKHPPYLPIAEVFLQACQAGGELTLRRWKGDWYRWREGRYEPVGKEEIQADILAFLQAAVEPEQISPSLIDGVCDLLKSLTLIDKTIAPPAWLDGQSTGPDRRFVAMANGILHLDALFEGGARSLAAVLHPLTSRWFSRTILGYPFDPAARCPLWESVLARILEKDKQRIKLLQEWFGYNLVADTSQRTLLILYGAGTNGKSLVCNVLTELLGPENVSGVPLEAFGSRFGLYPTLGKLANIIPEVGELDRVAEGVLKSFVGGDYATFDRKNRDPIQEQPTARLTVATNNLPRFSDRTEGIWSRILLLPFRVTIPAKEVDRNLLDKLRPELPGIFNWALKGLWRLRKRGEFTQPKVSVEALQEYREELNPAAQFLEAFTEPRGSVNCTELYTKYRDWIYEHGYKPLSNGNFSRELRHYYREVKRRHTGKRGKRQWVYDGVQFASGVKSI